MRRRMKRSWRRGATAYVYDPKLDMDTRRHQLSTSGLLTSNTHRNTSRRERRGGHGGRERERENFNKNPHPIKTSTLNHYHRRLR